jgi:fluoride exporter
MNIVLVFVGGGLGAAARYLVSGLVHRFVDPSFPYGTLAVNLLGCFAIGLFASMSEERFLINSSVRTFLGIGILGGFTTFSTFSIETLNLARDASFLFALGNVSLSVVGGLVAAWAGMSLGRLI